MCIRDRIVTLSDRMKWFFTSVQCLCLLIYLIDMVLKVRILVFRSAAFWERMRTVDRRFRCANLLPTMYSLSTGVCSHSSAVRSLHYGNLFIDPFELDTSTTFLPSPNPRFHSNTSVRRNDGGTGLIFLSIDPFLFGAVRRCSAAFIDYSIISANGRFVCPSNCAKHTSPVKMTFSPNYLVWLRTNVCVKNFARIRFSAAERSFNSWVRQMEVRSAAKMVLCSSLDPKQPFQHCLERQNNCCNSKTVELFEK